MKKLISILSAVVLLFCFAAFTGCTDNSAEINRLKEEVASLRAMLDEISPDDMETVAQLNAKVASLETLTSQLESIISNSTSGNAALQTQITSLTQSIVELNRTLESSQSDTDNLRTELERLRDQYNDDASGNIALKERIDELQQKYNDAESGNLALKAQIEALSATVTSLQETIAKNNTDIGKLQTTISSLNTDLTEAVTRIQLLEGAVQTDKNKVYNMGAWFTFKSNGLELFRVRLVDYTFMPGSTSDYVLNYQTQNIAMPNDLAQDKFFTIYAVDMNPETSEKNPLYYHRTSVRNSPLSYEISDINSVFDGNPTPSEVTHFIIGIPNYGPNQNSIIPYAVYKL